MAVSHKIATTVVWGSSTAGTLSEGKILSCEKKNVSKSVEQLDENGELYSFIFHDPRTEVSLEVLATASSVRPAVNSTITVAGGNFFVSESADKWTAGDTKKISISGWAVGDLI